MEIYQALLRQPGVKDVALERPLTSVRPDVSATIHGVPVAIEVQISALSMDTIIHRTQEYARKGIYVLWLPNGNLTWTAHATALASGRSGFMQRISAGSITGLKTCRWLSIASIRITGASLKPPGIRRMAKK